MSSVHTKRQSDMGSRNHGPEKNGEDWPGVEQLEKAQPGVLKAQTISPSVPGSKCSKQSNLCICSLCGLWSFPRACGHTHSGLLSSYSQCPSPPEVQTADLKENAMPQSFPPHWVGHSSLLLPAWPSFFNAKLWVRRQKSG